MASCRCMGLDEANVSFSLSFYMHVSVLSRACLGTMQARRGCHIPGNWLRAALWVLETKSRPSRKAASPLNVLLDKIQNIIILDTISWVHQGKKREFFCGGERHFTELQAERVCPVILTEKWPHFFPA